MPGIYTDVRLDELHNNGEGSADAGAGARGDGAAPSAPPIPGAGYLLEEPDESVVFRAIEQIVKAQERLAKNRHQAAKHWSRVRRGIPFSQLTKSEDRAEWRAELPPGIDDTAQPIPNKVDDLCGRIVSQVVVDPFLPDPKPENDTDRARHASDLAKRFLRRDGDEGGTNDAEVLRSALDIGMTHCSAYAHVWVDMEGAGWRPRRIKAHPLAVSEESALVGPDGMPTTDYQLRYVKDDGSFTENPAEAARQWLPRLRRDLLKPEHVRTVPESASVADANAVVLLMVQPLSDAKRRFPMLREMGDEQLVHLLDWRPPRAKALVPDALMGRYRQQELRRKEGKTERVADESLVFWYQKYCTQGVDYPDGADIAVSGANTGMILSRATLRDDIEVTDDTPTQPDSGMNTPEMGMQEQMAAPAPAGPMLKPVVRDIPVSQCLTLKDTEGFDPNGKAPIEAFGGANEARAQLYGGILEDVDRRLHPNVYVTASSTVQSWQITQRTGEPITVATKEDMPEHEQFANLPAFVPDTLERIDQDMATAAGLSETAMGLDASTAQSGVAKEAVIRQAKVALAHLYQNTTAFIKRYWRIKLQLAQAKLTVPQQVEYSGEDGAHKQRWWTGADLVGVGDVSLQAGSGTMMSPMEKQQFLMVAQQLGHIDPEEAAEAGRNLVAGDLGMTKRRHEELVDRQLATWTDGPPEGWAEMQMAFQAEQQAMQMAQQAQAEALAGAAAADPMQVQGMAQPAMQPTVPRPWTPFEPRPTDEDPAVAPIRYRKLREFIAGSDYSKHPPEWKAIVDMEYQRMRQAAGVATMGEQQAAMQQEQAAMAEQQSAELADREADREMKTTQADKDRQEHRSAKAQDRAWKLASASPAQAVS